MEIITRQVILETIGRIYAKAEDSKLEDKFLKTINDDLSLLARYFKTTNKQAFLIAMIFSLSFTGDRLDTSDLIRFFDCNPMKILAYHDDFEYLFSKGIIKQRHSKSLRKSAVVREQYHISEAVVDALLADLPLPDVAEEKVEDIMSLLNRIYKLAELRDRDDIETREIFAWTKEIIDDNLHYPLIEKISQFDFDIEDTYLYLYLIWSTLMGNESTDIGSAMADIYDNPSKIISAIQSMHAGSHILVKNKLVEIIEARFFSDWEMKLTEQSFNLLEECGIDFLLNKVKNKNIMSPSEITSQELIFDSKAMDQLFLIKDLLQEEKFTATQNRLSEKGLAKGIAVLLHGEPGTGKTEIVKQLAKETQREIMKVDISESKSMMYGQSEKIVKRIFTDYNTFAKSSERMPILLFNEADAIISKRGAVGNSDIQQTENAIQNIILEELENFKGILIATTNLVNNIDSAFERRFLFKVRFQKPSQSARARIWQLKLPFLMADECSLLAERFEFSGGQIDNVVRKSEIQEIVNGEPSTLSKMIAFCKEELLVTKKKTIGFSL